MIRSITLLIFIIISSVFNIANSSEIKKLPICLKTANCVSSQASIIDKQHYIEPFRIIGNVKDVWLNLKKELLNHDRMVITHETNDSLHAEAISLIFRFTDDINLILDYQKQLIHIRSASREGHTDFGINRKRIETLRKQLQKAGMIA